MEEETIQLVVYIMIALVGIIIWLVLHQLFGGGVTNTKEQLKGVIIGIAFVAGARKWRY